MSLTSKPTPEKVNQIRNKRKELAQVRYSHERFNAHLAAYEARQIAGKWDFGMMAMVLTYVLLISTGVIAITAGVMKWV
jgi:hypothetical protein